MGTITKYEAAVTNTGGRDGIVFSPDHSFSMVIEPPDKSGEKHAGASNPEQLFAAGYSACFNNALQSSLRRDKVDFESSTVTVFVALLYDPDEKGHRIGARIEASVKGISLDEAKKYVAIAHTRCPYSKAIQGNVDVKIDVVEAE
ncbi:MAG TPA: Ohr family peroxiredoxin [Flexilinea sp.]|nr:Ohr family peroxiredoxin [Flexilinea sp.]HPB40880.1 Ohr family peroxiredoxin [Flexilinea sp.]HPL58453.1 Ohr family peroxiredoxin [Flexilinea sp.]